MSQVSKPSISTEAQHRLRSFVHEAEALQERWGIQIVCEGDCQLLDAHRREQWLQPDEMLYGEYDASVVEADKPGGFKLKNLQIEDFEGWGK